MTRTPSGPVPAHGAHTHGAQSHTCTHSAGERLPCPDGRRPHRNAPPLRWRPDPHCSRRRCLRPRAPDSVRWAPQRAAHLQHGVDLVHALLVGRRLRRLLAHQHGVHGQRRGRQAHLQSRAHRARGFGLRAGRTLAQSWAPRRLQHCAASSPRRIGNTPRLCSTTSAAAAALPALRRRGLPAPAGQPTPAPRQRINQRVPLPARRGCAPRTRGAS